MSDTFQLSGTIATSTGLNPESGDPNIILTLDESMQLQNKLGTEYTLTTDAPVAVALGGLGAINALSIKPVGGTVTARISWATHATQYIPISGVLILMADDNITALDLIRPAGTVVTCKIFAGQQA